MPISASKSYSDTNAQNGTEQRVVLSIRDLRKSFGGQRVLDGVDADLHEGEVVLLRGDNGSGKTTLLNILTGNLEPDVGKIHLRPNGREETFQFPRKWWERLNPFDHFTPERVASEAVGRTWQDVRLFPTLSLSENIAVAKQAQPGENPWRALVLGLSASEAGNLLASASMLADLGLAGREESSGDKISLGQSKRVAIARAVQAGARILFLDEPLSGLDAPGIEEVLGLLTALARNERLTLVIVEHTFNIPRVLEFANAVWTLRQGRIQMQTPEVARAEFLLETGSGVIELVASQLGAAFTREDTPLYGGASLTRFSPKDAKTERAVALEVRNLVVRRGPRLVIGTETANGQIEALSLKFKEGDVAILQAPNGWGKSTLFGALCGVIEIAQGEIFVAERLINQLPVWERVNHGLHALSSDRRTFPNLRVREVLALAANDNSEGEFACLGHRHCASLSGGQKQLLGLHAQHGGSRGCTIQLMDEPYAALDLVATEKAIKGLSARGTAATLILTPIFSDRSPLVHTKEPTHD